MSFWVSFGHFGSFLAILGHFWSFLGHFGSFLVILGHFWPFLGHFVAFLDKFAESSNFFAGSLESRDSLLECMQARIKNLLLPAQIWAK